MSQGLIIKNTDGYTLLDTNNTTYTTNWVRNVTATESPSGVGARMVTSDSSFLVPGGIYAVRRASDPPGVLNMMVSNPTVTNALGFLNSGVVRNNSTYYVYVPDAANTWTLATLRPVVARSSASVGLLVFGSDGQLLFDSGAGFFSGLLIVTIPVDVNTPEQTFTYSVPVLPSDKNLWAIVSNGFRVGTTASNGSRLKWITGVSYSNGTLQVRILTTAGATSSDVAPVRNLSVIVGYMT